MLYLVPSQLPSISKLSITGGEEKVTVKVDEEGE